VPSGWSSASTIIGAGGVTLNTLRVDGPVLAERPQAIRRLAGRHRPMQQVHRERLLCPQLAPLLFDLRGCRLEQPERDALGVRIQPGHGATSVATRLTAGATGKSALAQGQLGAFGPLERRSEPLGRSDRRPTGSADEREEVVRAQEKKDHIAFTHFPSYPAHRTYPRRKVSQQGANQVNHGSDAAADRRTI